MAQPQPHIVLFSGGTAARAMNIALSRRPVRLTRVVPAWDSGGSSKELRETFAMLPVGDVRQALMTMAHGEGRAGEVVKVCNARLSDGAPAADLKREFDYFADGEHPLLHSMSAEMRAAILNYLGLFRDRMPAGFDLRNGSIGNFILTGAFFANGCNINRAVAVFRRLCGIVGNVWPASTLDDIQLRARLKDGRAIDRQDRITRLSEADGAVGIADIEIYRSGEDGKVEANDAVLMAVAEADLIVFGPGSFYTSILPHLHVDGVAEALASNARAPKVFVGNILECAETRGATFAEEVRAFNRTYAERGGQGDGLTHVLSNRELYPFAKTVGRFRYLAPGDLEETNRAAHIDGIVGDFEDAWVRGQHDGEAVASALLPLAVS